MTIELLSKPSCVQCTASKRAFDNNGLEYSIIDMTQDEQALATAKGLGYMAAPVIVVRDSEGTIVDHFSGFNPEKIKALSAIAA